MTVLSAANCSQEGARAEEVRGFMLLCTDLDERSLRCKGHVLIILACSCLVLVIQHLGLTSEKDCQ